MSTEVQQQEEPTRLNNTAYEPVFVHVAAGDTVSEED